jgi:hypothetical protein
LISLPADLASRMEDFIRRSTDCTAGSIFDHPLQKLDDDFGTILCGAQGVIMNVVPGGPFADFRLLNPQPLPFTTADAIRAMNAAIDFARDYAPVLQLDPAVAARLGVAAFAVAWEVWVGGQPLGAQNIIPGASLSGIITIPPSSTTTSSTACTACYASCSFVGPIEGCGTTCTQMTSCGTSSTLDVTTTTIIAWTAVAPAPSTFVPLPPTKPVLLRSRPIWKT